VIVIRSSDLLTMVKGVKPKSTIYLMVAQNPITATMAMKPTKMIESL
jgi:hypothetical protein